MSGVALTRKILVGEQLVACPTVLALAFFGFAHVRTFGASSLGVPRRVCEAAVPTFVTETL